MNRYRVKREGWTLGQVQGENVSEAQDRALDIYGLGAIVQELPIQNEPFDVDDVVHNRDLSIRPIHHVLSVQASSGETLISKVDKVSQTLVGKFIKEVRFLPFKATTYTVPTKREAPEQYTEYYAVIHYFDVAEIVTSKTLAQMMQKAQIHPGDVEFGIRLLGDLITNEALFEYAHTLDVEWSRNPDHHKDRTNCIQAIRRFRGWI